MRSRLAAVALEIFAMTLSFLSFSEYICYRAYIVRSSEKKLVESITRLFRMVFVLGTFEVEQNTDVIVLDRYLLPTPVNDISRAVVSYIFVDGKLVHKRP